MRNNLVVHATLLLARSLLLLGLVTALVWPRTGSVAAADGLQLSVAVAEANGVATIAVSIANPARKSIGLLDVRSSVPEGMRFLGAAAGGTSDGKTVYWIHTEMGTASSIGFEYSVDTANSRGTIAVTVVYMGESNGTLKASADIGSPPPPPAPPPPAEPEEVAPADVIAVPEELQSPICNDFPTGRANFSPEEKFARWVHVDRTALLAHALEGCEIVRNVEVTLGTWAWPTPVGAFRIIRRVESETMDSATIGIPRDAPGGYYLRGVLYTQYFTSDGAALHYNYWSPDSAFGRYPGSHGCVGMRLDDSRFFWDFATMGTPVIIVN